jgi:hypothetical protein
MTVGLSSGEIGVVRSAVVRLRGVTAQPADLTAIV